MKGNWFFIGISCLVGSLFQPGGGFLPLFLLLLYLLYLFFLQKFSKKQLLLVICLFLLYSMKGQLENHSHQTRLTGEEENFQITLMEPFKLDGNLFTAYGMDKHRGEKLAIQYRLRNFEEKLEVGDLSIGLLCTVSGNLREPEQARNPYAFDYKNYLRHEGIFWTLQIDRLDLTQCKQDESPLILLQNLRQRGIEYIYTHFPRDTAPLASALIFGDRTIMEPDLLTAYQRLGIIHLIAISGLNVAFLFGILFYCGLWIGITRERMMYVLLVFLPVYMVLTGGTPSVVRACFMMLLGILLTITMRKKLIPLDILSIVFIFYIFVDPKVIYDVGFQLSFVVTCSLVLSATILSKYLLRPVLFLVVTSLICQFASMPVLLYHFYEFSAVSFITNIFYVPLFSAVITPLLYGLFLLYSLTGAFINPVLSLFDFFLSLINHLTVLLGKFPLNTWILGRPPWVMMTLYGLGIPYALYRWEKANKLRSAGFALLIPLCLIGIQFTGGKLSPYGEVTMIDVGQGDSILIRLPYGRGNYLIDTGGTMTFPTEEWKERKDPFEVGKDVLVPFLKSKGVTKLDKLILTHGDLDHIGGSLEVMNSIRIKEVVMPKTVEKSELEQKIIDIAKNKKIPVREGKKGNRWRSANSTFTILSPSTDVKLERNDGSLVIHAQIGGKTWLFTGDIEREGERMLLSQSLDLKVDILKIGHHGSKTSTSLELLEKVNPETALISAGRDNRFGHPHNEVLSRLLDRGIKIYRTDQQGAITYRFKGKRGTFLTEIQYNKAKANQEN